jgi:shikimate dehydrogenase
MIVPKKMDDIVYSFTDLKNWHFPGKSLGIVGHPVHHSISAHMHNAALETMAKSDKQFKNWKYFKLDILAEELPEALDIMGKKGFVGLNITVPHKVHTLSLVKNIEQKAYRMGAVNTLHWKPGRELFAYNSDGYGLQKALHFGLDEKISNSIVILLGAGGAARAAAVQLLDSDCRELWIGNRSKKRLSNLLQTLSTHENSDRVRGFSLLELPRNLPCRGILINATSLGLKSTDPSPIDLDRFDQTLKIHDMIYNPVQTALVKKAREKGMVAINGLLMLIWQGVGSLEIWSGVQAPLHEMASAAVRALKSY